MRGIATVYGHAEWAKHKSSWRHARHMKTILSSPVVVAIGPPAVVCTLIAVFVSVFNHEVSEGHLPHWVPLLHVAPLPFSLTSAVLSLLIVFRTNSSYNRYDEARRAWGSTTNRIRDLSRQVLSWIQKPADLHNLHCLLRHIKAFSYCLKDHMLEANLLREELLEVLNDPQEVDSILGSDHRPNYVLQLLAHILKQCHVSEWERLSMDRNITQFHDNVGACERIFKTPIPVAYTRLTSRVLFIWHIFLPFALIDSCGWLTAPATFLSAAALFYIEEVGVLIEEPFSILPLLAICDSNFSSIDGLLTAHLAIRKLFCTQPREPTACGDHVVVTVLEGSRSCTLDRAIREQDTGVNTFKRVNSVS
ncbi:hypothetical protein M758_6G005800 [Ceratodon purpureus]|nr:hypothetical protein M758_6G005800 [Ceratodon purpureus]